MWKTNMETNLYSANICKHEHENIMTRLQCLKLMLNKLKEMRNLIPIYTPLWTQFKEDSMWTSSKKAF